MKSPLTFKGEPDIIFSKEEVVALAEPLKFALVGKISNGKPSLEAIQKVFAIFNLTSAYSICLIDKKHIPIRLNSKEDFFSIMASRSMICL